MFSPKAAADGQVCPICGGAVPTTVRGRPRMYCTTRCASTAGQREKRGRDREALTKAQRLAVAGAVAPRLRSKAPSRRRIHVTNAAGEVVRMITDTELTLGVLKTAAIEFDADVVDGDPKSVTVECAGCGRMTLRKKRGSGNVRAAKCIECRNGRCVDCGLIFKSESTVRGAKKRGNAPRCQPCRFAFLRAGKPAPAMTRTQLERRVVKLEAELKAACSSPSATYSGSTVIERLAAPVPK